MSGKKFNTALHKRDVTSRLKNKTRAFQRASPCLNGQLTKKKKTERWLYIAFPVPNMCEENIV